MQRGTFLSYITVATALMYCLVGSQAPVADPLPQQLGYGDNPRTIPLQCSSLRTRKDYFDCRSEDRRRNLDDMHGGEDGGDDSEN